MNKIIIQGLAFAIGSTIGLSAAVYSEAARRIEPKDGPKPFPIIIEKQTEEEPEKAVKLTAGERQMLQRVAIAEGGYTDADAQAMIMRVVINRRDDDSGCFPDSIEAVLYQRTGDNWQFSCMKEGGGFWSAKPNEVSAEALRMVEFGLDESGNALFFNQTGQRSWASQHREYIKTVGGNDFFG